MAKMMAEDERTGSPLVTSREPAGPKRVGAKGSVGDTAVMDAIYIIVGLWALIFFVYLSLNKYNH